VERIELKGLELVSGISLAIGNEETLSGSRALVGIQLLAVNEPTTQKERRDRSSAHKV